MRVHMLEYWTETFFEFDAVIELCSQLLIE